MNRLLIGLTLFFSGFFQAVHATDLLYVVAANNSVVTLDFSLSTASAVAASIKTFTSSSIFTANGLAFDSNKNLYVSNYGNITKYQPSGQYVSSFTGPGGYAYSRGVAVDSSGNIYAATTSNVIQKFDPAGNLLANVDTGLRNSDGTGLAIDSSGNLLASNWGSANFITKYNSNIAYLSTFATKGPHVFKNIAFDSSGNVYSSSQDMNIYKYSPSGNLISTIPLSGISGNVNGLAIDSSGNIYQADDAGIIKYSPSGLLLMAISGLPGSPRGIAFAPTTVPEPSNYALCLISTCFVAVLARRKRITWS